MDGWKDGWMDGWMEILGSVKESLTSYTCTLADLGPTVLPTHTPSLFSLIDCGIAAVPLSA